MSDRESMASPSDTDQDVPDSSATGPVTPVGTASLPRTPLADADEVEAIFHNALRAGDAQATADCLMVMAVVDAPRAARLHASLLHALDVAIALNGAERSDAGASSASTAGSGNESSVGDETP